MFQLQPKPTFKAVVTIPTFDGEAKVTFVFNHKGRKELRAFFERLTAEGENPLQDVDAISELVSDWVGVDQKYDRASLELMLDNYPGAASAIFSTYNKAVIEGRSKN